MHTSPSEIFAAVDALKRRQENFILATVIRVHGSTSAKLGAKAIFSSDGKNVLGWVGGGCAESFLSREATLSLNEKIPRIVNVDLDDEVFGLMPCGGTMDVYLEPHFPATPVNVPDCGRWSDSVQRFVRELGFEPHVELKDERQVGSWRDVFRILTSILAKAGGRSAQSLRRVREVNLAPRPQLVPAKQVVVLGSSRITEEFCRLSILLGWPVQVYSFTAPSEGLPAGVSVCEMPIDLKQLKIEPGAWVVVGSHHAQDHEFIAHALLSKAAYVALVASPKRSRLIHDALVDVPESRERLFAPAGLDLPSDTPGQIAFSVIAEILQLLGDNVGTC